MKKGESLLGDESTNGGISRAILFPKKLNEAIHEYQVYAYNKTGIRPRFADCVRALLIEALKNRHAYESEPDEENSKE